MKIQDLAEQVIFAVGLLAIEGRALPMNALREGLAEATINAEGYALSDADLDTVTVAVAHCALESGLVFLNDGKLYFKVPPPPVSEENLN